MGLLQSVLCDIDFNDSESYRGTSYLPFLGFMVFFAGMMIAFIGIVKYPIPDTSGIFSMMKETVKI